MGACGCLCFVLEFTVNIFPQSSASLSTGSRHLAALCWGDTKKETQGQFPPWGVLSHREKAWRPQGQGWSPRPSFRRDSALLSLSSWPRYPLEGPGTWLLKGGVQRLLGRWYRENRWVREGPAQSSCA